MVSGRPYGRYDPSEPRGESSTPSCSVRPSSFTAQPKAPAGLIKTGRSREPIALRSLAPSPPNPGGIKLSVPLGTFRTDLGRGTTPLTIFGRSNHRGATGSPPAGTWLFGKCPFGGQPVCSGENPVFDSSRPRSQPRRSSAATTLACRRRCQTAFRSPLRRLPVAHKRHAFREKGQFPRSKNP